MNLNYPSIEDRLLKNQDFWWLIGYIQGDGYVDTVDRQEIRLTSVERELILHADNVFKTLFRLEAKVRVEPHEPPLNPQFRLEVYSILLISWLLGLGLKFGTREWNVPRLPENLFLPYLAGLFDAEGSLLMTRNKTGEKKISHVMVYSTNKLALETISRLLADLGLRASILERKRRLHSDYELRMTGGEEKKWFVERVGAFVHHPRKRRYLNSMHLSAVREFSRKLLESRGNGHWYSNLKH